MTQRRSSPMLKREPSSERDMSFLKAFSFGTQSGVMAESLIPALQQLGDGREYPRSRVEAPSALSVKEEPLDTPRRSRAVPWHDDKDSRRNKDVTRTTRDGISYPTAPGVFPHKPLPFRSNHPHSGPLVEHQGGTRPPTEKALSKRPFEEHSYFPASKRPRVDHMPPLVGRQHSRTSSSQWPALNATIRRWCKCGIILQRGRGKCFQCCPKKCTKCGRVIARKLVVCQDCETERDIQSLSLEKTANVPVNATSYCTGSSAPNGNPALQQKKEVNGAGAFIEISQNLFTSGIPPTTAAKQPREVVAEERVAVGHHEMSSRLNHLCQRFLASSYEAEDNQEQLFWMKLSGMFRPTSHHGGQPLYTEPELTLQMDRVQLGITSFYREMQGKVHSLQQACEESNAKNQALHARVQELEGILTMDENVVPSIMPPAGSLTEVPNSAQGFNTYFGPPPRHYSRTTNGELEEGEIVDSNMTKEYDEEVKAELPEYPRTLLRYEED